MQNILIRSMQTNDVQAVTQIEQQVQTHPWTAQQFFGVG